VKVGLAGRWVHGHPVKYRAKNLAGACHGFLRKFLELIVHRTAVLTVRIHLPPAESLLRTSPNSLTVPHISRSVRRSRNHCKEQRWLWPLPGHQNAADDPFLDGELQLLRKAHRQGRALLDGLKIVVRYCAAVKRAGEPVGGGNRILHRHIYSHAADRRHRVGHIADADQPRPPPFSQSIDRDAKELDVIPVFQFADTISRAPD
jgi:hypothetical protein